MKRIVAILVVALFSIGAVFASVDMKLALGGQSNGNIEISESSTQFDFTVDAEFDMDFNRGHGMLIGLELTKSDIALSVGYAYQTDISSNCDFILGAGAIIGLNPAVSLDYFVTADFDFYISQDMYIRLGTGIITNFGKLDENYATKPKFIFPLPAIGFGWDF